MDDSKIMEVKNKAPEVMNVTQNIMEAGDWIVNQLTGQNVRSNCGLGFKSFWEEMKDSIMIYLIKSTMNYLQSCVTKSMRQS